MALRETDILTGLYTPGYLVAYGARELAFAKENGYPISLITLFIHDPASIDPSERPDRITESVRQVGEKISREAGDGAIVARTGETEIAVLLPGINATRAAGIAYKIKKIIAPTKSGTPAGSGKKVSIGISSSNGTKATISDLIASARAALEDSKNKGSLVIRK